MADRIHMEVVEARVRFHSDLVVSRILAIAGRTGPEFRRELRALAEWVSADVDSLLRELAAQPTPLNPGRSSRPGTRPPIPDPGRTR